MRHEKITSPTSTPYMRPIDPLDPSSERLGKIFVFTAVSGEDFVDEEHEPALREEPVVEPSYPTSWTWIGRPGDHRP